MSVSRVTLPYRVLPQASVSSPGGWEISDVATGVPVRVEDGEMQAWDYDRRLRVARRYAISREGLDALGLSASSARLALTVTASTAGGLLAEEVFRACLQDEQYQVDVAFEPNSASLSRVLRLTTRLSLTAQFSPIDPFAPALAGARLWSDTEEIKLERSAGRLPMQSMSFREAFSSSPMERALFHLVACSDLTLPFEMSLVVYLNSDYPRFVEDLTRGDKVATALLWDAVIRRLVMLALVDPEQLEMDLPAGSLGASIRRWITQAFPRTSPGEVVRSWTRDVSRFESTLQGWTSKVAEIYAEGIST